MHNTFEMGRGMFSTATMRSLAQLCLFYEYNVAGRW